MNRSTGLANTALGTSSVNTALTLGFIDIYAVGGGIPASPDAAVTSPALLVTISNNSTGTGVTFDSAVNGALPKKASETWSGTIASSGTAAFFRYRSSSESVGASQGASTSASRLQGTVGTAGTDMVLSTVSLTASATLALSAFEIDLN